MVQKDQAGQWQEDALCATNLAPKGMFDYWLLGKGFVVFNEYDVFYATGC